MILDCSAVWITFVIFYAVKIVESKQNFINRDHKMFFIFPKKKKKEMKLLRVKTETRSRNQAKKVTTEDVRHD